MCILYLRRWSQSKKPVEAAETSARARPRRSAAPGARRVRKTARRPECRNRRPAPSARRVRACRPGCSTGRSPPRESTSSRSGTTRSMSMSITLPKPSHVGHAPSGLLKLYSRGSGAGYSMSQFSQTSRVLKPSATPRPAVERVRRARRSRRRRSRAWQRPLPLAKPVSNESRSRSSDDAVGLEPIDDDVERTVAVRPTAGDSGSGSVDRFDQAIAGDDAKKPSSLSEAANSSRSTPFGQGDAERRPGIACPAEARPALGRRSAGESRRTSSPHFRQKTWPILAYNSRR